MLHELLDQPNVKNYDGSWTEYGSLVGVPIEKGAEHVRSNHGGSVRWSDVDLAKETVIQGVVIRGRVNPSQPRTFGCSTATGEFTAEVVTSATGQFRFFARPGDWTLRVLSSSGTGEAKVSAGRGEAVETQVTIPA